jgi:hypothetical protein
MTYSPTYTNTQILTLPSSRRVRVLVDKGTYITARYVRPGRPAETTDKDMLYLSKKFLKTWMTLPPIDLKHP